MGILVLRSVIEMSVIAIVMLVFNFLVHGGDVEKTIAPQMAMVQPTPSVTVSPSPSPTATATVPYTQHEKVTEHNPSTDIKTDGEYGEVTTVAGNGVVGESSYMLDHPRYPAPDSKGNIYFLDGTQKSAKLRVVKNNQAKTLLDLTKNTVTAREGEFFKTGVAVVKDKVYFSSEEKVYLYTNERATVADEKIKTWMKDNKYEYVYRMKSYKDKLILMLFRKNYTYGFVSYDPSTRKIEQILEPKEYPNASNFFVHDLGITVSSELGYVWYEKIFPRKSLTYIDTNEGKILDSWSDNDKVLYWVLGDNVHYQIKALDFQSEDPFLVAGGGLGFVDGVRDEAAMDNPTDFIWDGSGYLFSDMNNNAIRKLWVKVPPRS
jgi:hypothetical protein